MNVNRWGTGWVAVAALVGGQWLAVPAHGRGSESAGMITELKVDRGRVEVRPAGAQEWRKAGPLLALRAGDTIRVSDEATAVILLSGGRGTGRGTQANSPFAVAAPPPGGRASASCPRRPRKSRGPRSPPAAGPNRP